jgi:hypothetical protein
MPIVAGLLLAAPIALLTGVPPAPAIAKFLVTPDELRPAPVLANALKGHLSGSEQDLPCNR